MKKSLLTLLVLSLVPASLAAASRVGGGQGAAPGSLGLDEIRALLARPGANEPYVPQAPLGITADLATMIPKENPITPAKVELGRQLYFDPRLSRDGTVSCATCHDPARGWTDCSPVSTGIEGQKGSRSAPTVVNRILGKTQFWDGRAASLEEQALGPIANPVEMGFTHEDAAAMVAKVPGYALEFQAVFGGPPTADAISKAIAAFERTVLSGGSENDYYEQALPYFDYQPDDGEDPAFVAKVDAILDAEAAHRMSEAAERGRGLFFGKAKCSACHVGQDLTDEDFHNIGVGFPSDHPDVGRESQTGTQSHRGAFKTPSLRNIALTAPYMHDGSMKTLAEVVEHYDKGGNPNPWLDPKVFPLGLTPDEKQDLVTFLQEALTGPITNVEIPRLP